MDLEVRCDLWHTWVMRVADIIRSKGDVVATISPDATIADAVAQLHDVGVGALVVTDDADAVAGIISERDVVRRLHTDGVATLDRHVRDLMTADVVCCGRQDTIADLMALMTERRIRHLPVLDDDELVGVVSIGDVVKARVGELEDERHHLEDYITRGV